MDESSDEELKRLREFMKNRISEEAVARILGLIAAPPNQREAPLAGDPLSPFDFWFDGGACQMITGWNEFRFQDGTVAQVGTCLHLSVDIRFLDGRRVKVQQEN